MLNQLIAIRFDLADVANFCELLSIFWVPLPMRDFYLVSVALALAVAVLLCLAVVGWKCFSFFFFWSNRQGENLLQQ